MLLGKGKKPTLRQRLIFWGVVLSLAGAAAWGVRWYDTNARFVIAIREGKVDVAREYLASGSDPNVRIPLKINEKFVRVTPLDAALTTNAPELVELLLKAGADPNGKNTEGMSVLMSAILDGDKAEIVRLFLEHGANPNGEASDSLPPLLLASGQGLSADVRVLLRAGADIGAVGKKRGGRTDGYNALMYYIEFASDEGKEIEVPRILLDAGLNLDHKSDSGESALLLAEKKFPKSALLAFLKERASR